jgi:hypothetical protein
MLKPKLPPHLQAPSRIFPAQKSDNKSGFTEISAPSTSQRPPNLFKKLALSLPKGRTLANFDTQNSKFALKQALHHQNHHNIYCESTRVFSHIFSSLIFSEFTTFAYCLTFSASLRTLR